MEELTIEEMTSLKGGFFDETNAAVVTALGNIAIAAPVNVETNANNASAAFGSIASAGQGHIIQNANANAGNQAVAISQST